MIIPREKYNDYYIGELMAQEFRDKYRITDDWEESECLDYEEQYPRLAFLPKKANKHEYHEGDYRSRYYNSYHRAVGNLARVRLDKFVGQPMDKIISRYSERYNRSHAQAYRYRSNKVMDMLYLFDVYLAFRSKKGTMLVVDSTYRHDIKTIAEALRGWRWRGRGEVFYIHPDTGNLMHKVRDGQRHKSEDVRRGLIEAAEQKRQRRKAARLRKRQREEESWGRFWEGINKAKEKAKKERVLDDQKMVAKGFDPLTSFRNVPRLAA